MSEHQRLPMRIGLLSLPLTGHLHPMTALARKLQSRENDVVFIGVPDVGSIARAAGLTFVSYCDEEYPEGSTARIWGPIAKLHGLEVAEYSASVILPPFIQATLEHLPETLAETGVDALVIDTLHFYAELVPMSLGIPFVHVWNILHMDRSGTTPMCYFSWPHETTPEAVARNLEGLRQIGIRAAPMLEPAMRYVERAGLQIVWSDPMVADSKSAVITQIPKEFDFPGIPWPAHFHYAGPFHDNSGREVTPFAWDELDDKPLIYASLGTLVNGLSDVYRVILEAVRKLSGIQVVLSVGKNVDLDDLGLTPTNTIIVRSAPQIDLLKRAALCITHAGLNTALEALAQGVPIVAIPIAYDQPGVASRIAYHGVGEFIELEALTAEALSESILKVMENPSYRDRAGYLQRVIADTDGLDVAADVIEQAFRTTPVSRARRGSSKS
jgi:zeaxanthin glucosyltransferase